MLNTTNTAYAYKHGNLVHVSTVVSGLKCGCYCSKCNNPVVARKGQIREHHFAHTPGTECSGAAETVLHILSKEIISELNSILIPAYNYKRTKKFPNRKSIVHEEKLANGGKVSIDAVEIEKTLGSFKPDIVILSQGKKPIVEIAVTHKVGKRKQRKLRKYNVPAIEIRIPEEYALKAKKELKFIIKNNTNIKYWLYHPKEKQANSTFYTKYRAIKGRYPRYKTYDSSRFGSSSVPSSRRERNQFKTTTEVNWYEINRRVEGFNQKYGRYPSSQEAIKLWPWLYDQKPDHNKN